MRAHVHNYIFNKIINKLSEAHLNGLKYVNKKICKIHKKIN